eukprot:6108098-Heterocapsa_arctica.AAC.1
MEVDVGAGAPLLPRGQVHSKTFEEVAARLVDLRGVARPPSFSGRDTEWAEFKFSMESIATLLGCDGIMAEAIRDAEDADMDLLTEDDAARSRFLYNLLVQMCHG